MCCYYKFVKKKPQLQLSASPSMPRKVAYTFVSYEAVRCKSYRSSIPKSVIVNE